MILGRLVWPCLPFDHTHDLDLGVSSSESKKALSQKWGSRLTVNEKDVSHPFMTMILTYVTMVGWADVPDSDRGDFRRRRAVYISSYFSYKSRMFVLENLDIELINPLWNWSKIYRHECMIVLCWVSFRNDCTILTHLSLDKMAAISQTIFSDVFS